MASFNLRSSVILRLIIIGVLGLVLLIPAALIQDVITEREGRRDEATREVSEKWGGIQTVSGPMLTVPFKKLFKDTAGKIATYIEYAHFLPEQLNIDAKLDPEIRHRGIYDIVLYKSDLTFTGKFLAPDFAGLNIAEADVMWKDAYLALGLTDLKGIKEIVKVKWNDTTLTANPGLESNDVINIGISSKPVLAALTRDATVSGGGYDFSMNVKLNGSTEMSFTPVGRETVVKTNSSWRNPSFAGAYLPETREVSEKGFTAAWKILHLNRNYPQQWIGNTQSIQGSQFGVRLLLLVDEYQKNMRSAKYAIMFIFLTFLALFMTEVLNRKSIHPIQYILIGIALLVFYTLLLSLSEQIGFGLAYLAASAAIISLITGYTKSVLGGLRETLAIAGILSLLYGFLFVILQLEDYALLLGSVFLFAVLAAVMYLTRKIDWFNAGKAAASESPESKPVA
ncbi:MAG: cell envelope integrity protein CreD [Rhizobacter sp.]|nr:cell envelope integrity protein CreD [Chlorobiales bacterium]